MKKIYLTLTAITLALMGTLLTLVPNAYTSILGSPLSDPNLLNIMRSIGGFYLGFAAFLVVTLKKELVDAGVISAVLAMVGLLTGRAISLAADGAAHPRLWGSLTIELIFAAWGLFILLRPTQSKQNRAHSVVRPDKEKQ
jgi:hypothetical protein